MKKKLYKQGEMINNLKFIREIENAGRRRKCVFECVCGNEFIVNLEAVKCGNTKSCGCLKSKKTIERNLKHGNATRGGKDYWYHLWNNIKERCYQSRNKNYNRYGGRGIIMQEDWINDFQKFKNDILATIGEKPKGMSLDRINNDDNYKLNNLRWATAQQQALNRYNNK